MVSRNLIIGLALPGVVIDLLCLVGWLAYRLTMPLLIERLEG